MYLKHEDATALKREIRRIVGKHLDLSRYRVFFFGSRVQGTSDERSDIDVGIEGPAPVPGDVRFLIREEIEALPVLYKMDVVDFAAVDDDFRRIALRDIELITD